MTMVSAQRSTLNPNAPLFVPAAVRQVEDFSPEWWELVTTSTWFHDYWLSQQQGEDGFFGSNTQDDFDIVDVLPDSIYAEDEDILTMESEYEQFLSELEKKNTYAPSSFKQTPMNGLELELKPTRERGPKSPVKTARYWEKPAKPVSPKVRTQRIQQPR